MNSSKIKEIVKKSISMAIDMCGSQAALAKKTGITQGAVGKYYRGEALPRGETANALSRAVDGKLKPSDFAPHIFQQTDPLLIANESLKRRVTDHSIMNE